MTGVNQKNDHLCIKLLLIFFKWKLFWVERRFFYLYLFFSDLEKSLANVNGTGGTLDYMESPVSDGTIEENFEEELVNAPQIVDGTTSVNDKETGNLLDDLEADDVIIIIIKKPYITKKKLFQNN